MVGNGANIITTRDLWLFNKENFRVEDDHRYAGRNERVEELFISNTKTWNEIKI